MLPSPLHPAVVHFPIVLMFLLPLTILAALGWIRRGGHRQRAWLIPVMVAALLSGAAWAAVETGEGQEDRAEKVVGETAVSQHEHAAERFLMLSLGVLGITGLGMLRGRAGAIARWAAPGAAAVLLVAGYQVGRSGGELVYGDGNRPGLVGAVTASSEGEHGRDADPDREEADDREDSDD